LIKIFGFSLLAGACAFVVIGFSAGQDAAGPGGLDMGAVVRSLGRGIAWMTLVALPALALIVNAAIVVSLERRHRSIRH